VVLPDADLGGVLRLPLYSLRTGILAELTFLIVAAMLLINVVMVKFAERDLIEARIRTARLFVHAIEKQAWMFMPERGDLRAASSNTRFIRSVEALKADGGFSDILLIDAKGTPVAVTGAERRSSGDAVVSALEAVRTKSESASFRGRTWGVLWFEHKEFCLSVPLSYENRVVGGIHLRASLIPVYRDLRKSQKIIFMYILLDTLVLVVVGFYLLSRIVVKPINRLLKMTSEYTEGELMPSLEESSANEIGELSRSLNHMLRRLEQNKIEMKNHVLSLEKANRELQQAQDEIIRSEKFASVGRLGAGIAHEIGNPIGIVLGYLELLEKNDVTETERKDFLERIEDEITRISGIIRQLLDYSRPSEGVREPVAVHEIVIKTLDILGPQPMMEDIQIDIETRATRDTVYADPNLLQQVFLNIIMNAADALAEADSRNGSDSKKSLGIRSRNTDRKIEIIFEDNGPGIPQEDLGRIFDPFYTTKEPGKGTGLGLSVSYRIVEDIGGTLWAESTLGKGTILRVGLPLSENS